MITYPFHIFLQHSPLFFITV